MRLAFASTIPADTVRPPLRQRATSLAMAVAVTLLLIIGLLTLNGSVPQRPQFKGGPVLIDLKSDEEKADATQKPARAKPEAAPKEPTPTPPRPIPVPQVPPPPPMPTRSYYIHLTPEENEQADISKHPRVAMSNGGSGNSQGVAQASAAGDSRPVGTAPNGQPLYEAEWYRRPTDAELGFYLPPHVPAEGFGLVACRTIANHHVDDCVELGSSPAGSHLAGAVRQAAWQFLVRAPRLGGKELVGTWVRIRIDYIQKHKPTAETPEEAPEPGGDPG